MLVTRRYKWLVMSGAVIRLIGYGLMIRLRGQYNSTAELYAQQIIQGMGSGIVQTSLLIPPQIVVPHTQVAQVLSLAFSMLFLGFSVGSAIAGGMYTNMLRPLLWEYLPEDATQEAVDGLYNSITGVLPAWGTPDRDAVNLAVSHDRPPLPGEETANEMIYQYTEVTKNFAYTSIGVSVLVVLMCFPFPDLVLPRYVSTYLPQVLLSLNAPLTSCGKGSYDPNRPRWGQRNVSS